LWKTIFANLFIPFAFLEASVWIAFMTLEVIDKILQDWIFNIADSSFHNLQCQKVASMSYVWWHFLHPNEEVDVWRASILEFGSYPIVRYFSK